MLTILGAGVAMVAIIFLFYFLIVDAFKGNFGILKEIIICALVSAVFIGGTLLIGNLKYVDVTTNEYEIVSLSGNTFSYITDDKGVAKKWMDSEKFVVYENKNDKFYAVEKTKRVSSKMNEFLHELLTFDTTIGDEETTYKVYMPSDKYEEYISK